MTDQYSSSFAESGRLYERAVSLLPAGISHDSRRLQPFPHYVVRAAGSHKWDEDGHELIDYVLGHAALMLGHAHPDIVAAVQAQVAIVTHPGACHRLEVDWAEWICRLVPSAERVRFVMTGTEATLLALRIARAFTQRDVVIRIQGHFHGWHDYVTGDPHLDYDTASSAGVPDSVRLSVRVARLNDIDDLERLLKLDAVAAVIMEPEGARSGTVPPPAGYLEQVREACSRAGALLIFDEVVSGFRVAPGGVQEYTGVTPDLTTLAKAVAGGLPGGAVCGRADVLDVLGWPTSMRRVLHQGTWNANPLAASAGIAALSLLSDGSAQRYVSDLGTRLRDGLNEVIRASQVAGFSFGDHSSFRIILGDDLSSSRRPADLVHVVPAGRLLKGMAPALGWAVHRALLLEGIDFMRGDHGWLSTAHDDADIDATLAAFERALARLIADGTLTRRAAAA